jgi:hypothetical protein
MKKALICDSAEQRHLSLLYGPIALWLCPNRFGCGLKRFYFYWPTGKGPINFLLTWSP